MDGKNVWPELKCFGSATVGARGQVVIPVSARKELNIDTGATLLVFIGPGKRGLTLIKADAVEQIVNMLSEQLSNVEKLLKNYASKAANTSSREEVNEED